VNCSQDLVPIVNVQEETIGENLDALRVLANSIDVRLLALGAKA
jgi:hypothetical protein